MSRSSRRSPYSHARAIRRGLSLSVAVLALAGCPAMNLITAPGDPVPLEFEVVEAGHGTWLENPEIDVQGLTGAILIETLMSTPDPCRRFEATAYEGGGGITLAVEVLPVQSICIAVVGTFEYKAKLSELGPGTHRLVITHAFKGTGDEGPRTVFDAPVQVR